MIFTLFFEVFNAFRTSERTWNEIKVLFGTQPFIYVSGYIFVNNSNMSEIYCLNTGYTETMDSWLKIKSGQKFQSGDIKISPFAHERVRPKIFEMPQH